MTTHRALVVPADVTRPTVLYDLPDGAWVAEVTGIVGGNLDFASFGRFGFLVAVYEYGALEPAVPLNTRAMNYVRVLTAYQGAYPLYGDAVFMGCDEAGEYADIPDRLLVAAGIRS